MVTAIFATIAHLDDDAEMATFLAPIPDGEQLAKVLIDGKAVSTRAYEDETRTARFVESDGIIVMCFTVSDVTIDQAEMIEAAWEDICALDETAFRKAVERVLNLS
jgi:regulator of RNase E activity RraB